MENQLDTVESTKNLCNQLFDLVKEYSILDGSPCMEYQLEYLKGFISYMAIQDLGIAFRVKRRIDVLNKELQTSRPYQR